MNRLKFIVWGLVALPVAEVAAFAVVAHLTSLATAVMLLILVSVSGVLVLRRSGTAMTRTDSSAAAGIATIRLGGIDLSKGLAGVLLVVPGFVTGLLGLLVMVPLSRQWLLAALTRFFVQSGKPQTPDVIDLAPGDWQELPDDAPSAAKPRKRRRAPRSRPVGSPDWDRLDPSE
jgi:UPF0716 protein FxsA